MHPTTRSNPDPLREPVPGLSEAQALAFRIAEAAQKHVVFAGHNVIGRRLYRVAYPALAALERQGLLVLSFSPDGGIMGERTDRQPGQQARPTPEAVIAAVRARGSDAGDLRDAAHEGCHAIQAGLKDGWARETIHQALLAHFSGREGRGMLWRAEMQARAVERLVCDDLGVEIGAKFMSLDGAVGVSFFEAVQWRLPFADHDVSLRLAESELRGPECRRVADAVLALAAQPRSSAGQAQKRRGAPRAAR